MILDVVRQRGPGWVVRRLRRSERGELAWRARSLVDAQRWKRAAPPPAELRIDAAQIALPGGAAAAFRRVSPQLISALISEADALMAGSATILGARRTDLAAPDWEAAAHDDSWPNDLGTAQPVGFSVKHRWELLRGGVPLRLCAAFALTGDRRHGDRALDLLGGCWDGAAGGGEQLSGVELALRLVSWTWCRRLLDAHPDVASRFDAHANSSAVIARYQDYLVRFPSCFSSANNHRLVEAAGLLVGACALPSGGAGAADPRQLGLTRLQDELALQVTQAGMHREQAFEYHCFVLDAAAVALCEAGHTGLQVDPRSWDAVQRMAQALNAVVDERGEGPRHGDGDDSVVVEVGGCETSPTRRSLALAGALGLCRTSIGMDVRASLLASLRSSPPLGPAAPSPDDDVAARREAVARSSGPVVLTRPAAVEGAPGALHGEAWVSVRTGPLGYRLIAAHAHADLGAVELRVGGVPLLVDPGTFLYDAAPGWRRHLRSTAAHNTVSVDGEDQAEYWGPFVWGSSATSTVDRLERAGGALVGVTVSHDGYTRGQRPAVHRRTVRLDRGGLRIEDRVLRSVPSQVSVCFTFHPAFTVELDGTAAALRTADAPAAAVSLDPRLTWTHALGRHDGFGWCSPEFGVLRPAPALIGTGRLGPDDTLTCEVTW